MLGTLEHAGTVKTSSVKHVRNPKSSWDIVRIMSKAVRFPVGSLEMRMWITPGNRQASRPREFENMKLLFGVAFAFCLPGPPTLPALATIAPGKTGTEMSNDHWLRKIDILHRGFCAPVNES